MANNNQRRGGDGPPKGNRGPRNDQRTFERGAKSQNAHSPRDFKGGVPQGRRDAPAPRPAYRPDSPAPRRATPPRHQIPPAVQVPPATRVPPDVQVPPAAQVPPAPLQPELPENLLVGRNPIREALKSGQPIEKMLVATGELTGSAREIVAMARERHIVIQYVDRARLTQVYPNHQGMLAYASAAEYATVEDILELAASRDEDAFVVALDGITDPHNLGAIIRSAECMGAHGVVIPERRSAGLNPAAVKAAAGALSHIKVARVVNLARTLEQLKNKGLWVTGAVTDGVPASQVSLNGPIALVIGSEGDGIGPIVRRQCDQLVRLTLYGQIESLNASVAAGILMYEIARARNDG